MVILGHKVKLTPIKIPEVKLTNCDKDGNSVKKILKQKAEYYWQNEKGEIVDKVYKKIGDKVVNKLKKTETITKAIPVSKTEAFDLVEELVYFVEADESFKREIIDNDIAYKFIYSNGNGFKIYPLTYLVGRGDDLIMVCGTITKSQAIKEIKEGKATITEIEALKLDGVQNASADEIASLYVLNKE